MKSPLTLFLAIALVCSVAGNVYLATRSATSSSSSGAPTAVDRSTPTATATSPSTTTINTTGAAPELPRWQPVRSTSDAKRLADQMTRAGYPRAVILTVIQRTINDHFADQDPAAKLPFWQRYPGDPEMARKQSEFVELKTKALEEVLGPTASVQLLDPAHREMRYGPLSDEKILAVQNLQKEYSAIRQQHMNRRSNSYMHDDPDLVKMRALEEEMQADLRALMTPEEYEAYDKRSGRAATVVMSGVRGLNVTETEYDSLYRLQNDLNNKYPLFSSTTDWKQRNADTDAVLAGSREVLGDERFLLYLESTQPNYNAVKRFVDQKVSTLNTDQRIALFQAQRDLETLNWQRATPGQSVDVPTEVARLRQRFETLLGPQLAAEYISRGPAQPMLRMLNAAAPGP